MALEKILDEYKHEEKCKKFTSSSVAVARAILFGEYKPTVFALNPKKHLLFESVGVYKLQMRHMLFQFSKDAYSSLHSFFSK